MRRTTMAFCAALALTTLSGCLTIDAPKDFLLIEESASSLKLITPDEAKLWVRDLDDPDQGDLEFWVEALQNDLTERRGYTLLESRDIRDDGGRPGKEWTYEATVDGLTRRYLIAISVHEGTFSNTIRVSEYLAPKATFDERLEDVRVAIASVGS